MHENRSESRLYDEIVSTVAGKGGVLIIDEAQQIDDAKNNHCMDIINTLRSFVDAKAFGVVLLGNNEIYRRLNKENAHQVLGRITAWRVEIKGASDNDIDEVIRAWGVSGKAERAICLKIAKRGGGLHALISAFRASLGRFDLISADTLELFVKG